MHIHIIIPVFNNSAVTLTCLAQIFKQTYTDYHVYIIDDGSTDGTAQAVGEHYPLTTIINGNGSLWWAGAVNEGIRYIFNHDYHDSDYILTLNDDVDFDRNYLKNFVKAARMRPGWLIGSLCIDKHDQSKIDCGKHYSWEKRTREKTCVFDDDGFKDNVNCLSGRGALIPLLTFKDIGLYESKRLPQYGADYELSFRAIANDYKVCVYQDAKVINDSKISGHKYTPLQKLALNKAWLLLTSNKSAHNIRTRFNFVLLCCPQRYLAKNIAHEILDMIQIFTSIQPLWQLKVVIAKLIGQKHSTKHEP